jgi:hypothetical protein
MSRKVSVAALVLFACSLLPAQASLPASHAGPSSIFNAPATLQMTEATQKTSSTGRQSLKVRKVSQVACYYVYRYYCNAYGTCWWVWVRECY